MELKSWLMSRNLISIRRLGSVGLTRQLYRSLRSQTSDKYGSLT